jgi:hypothetical protein
VLKDAEKPITLDNINFNIFHAHINFNDFKINQYSHIKEIIKEVTHSGFTSPKKKVLSDKNNNSYIKLHSYNSNVNFNSKGISFSERKDVNKHNKELFKSYIEQKIFNKKLKFDEDSYDDSSEDDDEEGENMGNDYVQFRYRKKYDIKNLRKILIDKINNDRNDSEEEKELYIEIINSNIFIQLLNCLELKDIIELEKNFDLIIDLLKFLENLRLRENEDEFKLENDEKEQKSKNDDINEDNKSNSSSSFSNSLNIDIDEKKVFKNETRRTTFLIEPNFYFDINNLKFLRHSKKIKKNKNNVSSCVDIKKDNHKSHMFNKNINQDNEKEINSSKNLLKYVQPFN